MGRRGPAPTPTPILNARGSWRGKKRKGEPTPDAIGCADDCPPAPRWLGAEAMVIWQALAAELAALGVLTSIDAAAMARYCDATIRFRKTAAFLDANGDAYSIKDKAGKAKIVLPFPQVAIYHKLQVMLLRLEQEFGLTPASRSRIQSPPAAGHVGTAPMAAPKAASLSTFKMSIAG